MVMAILKTLLQQPSIANLPISEVLLHADIEVRGAIINDPSIVSFLEVSKKIRYRRQACKILVKFWGAPN